MQSQELTPPLDPERRWLVERFFAWLQWKRRLLMRWEYYASNFLGFV